MGTEAIAKASARSPYDAIAPMGKNIDLMSPEDILAYVALALDNIGSQLNDYKDAVVGKQKKAAVVRELMGEVRAMSQNGQPLTAYDKEKYDALMNKLASVKGGDPELEAVYDTFMKSYGGYTDAEGNDVGTLATDDGMTFGQVLEGGKAVNAAELKKMKPGESLGEKDKDLKAKAASDPLSKKEDLGAPKLWDSQLPADTIPSPQTEPAKQLEAPDSQDAHLTVEELNQIAERLKSSLENLNSDNELTMMGLQQLMQQRNQISQFSSNMLNSVNEGLKSIIANWRLPAMSMTQESVLLTIDAMFNLAVDCRERGKIDEALEMFRFLSALDPHDAGVWQAMARCHDDLGQTAAAAAIRSLGEQLAGQAGEVAP